MSRDVADVVFAGGTVYTVDAARSRARAVAVRGDSIVAVGSEDEVVEHVGRRTEVVDLDGRMLLPGFHDAHVHAPSGGLDRLRLDLSQIHDVAGYRRAIRGYAVDHPRDPWILGGGWWAGYFPGGSPGRSELDLLVPDRPAFINDRNNHSAWVNSRALELAGIDGDTPDPLDGRIVRGVDGRPSGQLLEGAMDLVRRHAPRADAGLQERGLLVAQSYLHSLGITAWQDAIVGEYSTIQDSYDAYLGLASRGELTARVVGALWFERGNGLGQLDHLEDRAARGAAGRFRATTVKPMVDGGCENHSAAMLEPYLDLDGTRSGNTGIEFFSPDELREAVVGLDAAGFQLHIHVLGDRAARSALDAFEAARSENGANDQRHHMAHVQNLHPDDLPRFRSLDLVVNAQPLWACHGRPMDDLVIPHLGEPRASRQFPFASLARAGVRLAFGSDWPVTAANPIWGIHVAVNRTPPPDAPDATPEDLSTPFVPEERLDLSDAIAAYTMGSAYVNHLDEITGSIEVGKLADLIVVDRDLFSLHPEEIGTANVAMTMVGGQVVSEAE